MKIEILLTAIEARLAVDKVVARARSIAVATGLRASNVQREIAPKSH
jgi:hypothetical protein